MPELRREGFHPGRFSFAARNEKRQRLTRNGGVKVRGSQAANPVRRLINQKLRANGWI